RVVLASITESLGHPGEGQMDVVRPESELAHRFDQLPSQPHSLAQVVEEKDEPVQDRCDTRRTGRRLRAVIREPHGAVRCTHQAANRRPGDEGGLDAEGTEGAEYTNME